MQPRYPNREMLEQLCKTALNAAYIKADITGDGMPETFCNSFVHTLAVACGFLGVSKPDGSAISANQMIAMLETAPDVERLSRDAEVAQAWANAGYLVIAAHRADPHGHVAVVMPGAAQPSGTHGHALPNGANVGRSNFVGKHLGWAFTHAQCPAYYAWKGTV